MYFIVDVIIELFLLTFGTDDIALTFLVDNRGREEGGRKVYG